MPGRSRETGRAITNYEHAVQSVNDIATTRIGTRVMRRNYGSNLADLIGRPQGYDTALEAVMALAEPVNRWEPRIVLTRVRPTMVSRDGKFELSYDMIYFPKGHLGDYSLVENFDGNILKVAV